MAELVVGLENNQKILIPTSSEARSGNPLGTILAIHSNVVPYGYLPCNGVAFDENQYPALYAMLGDNHTPYSYDKSRLGEWEKVTISTDSNNPTVMPYDGFLTVRNLVGTSAFNVYVNGEIITNEGASSNAPRGKTLPFRKGDLIYTNETQDSSSYFLACYYTHFNVIKATSGLEETQQDYVLQSLLEADSYSTEEVATGKKWIDGKMIYRRVGVCLTQGSTSSNQNYSALDMSANNVASVIDGRIIEVGSSSARYVFNSCLWRIGSNGALSFWCSGQGWSPAETGNTRYVVVEYTKAD